MSVDNAVDCRGNVGEGLQVGGQGVEGWVGGGVAVVAPCFRKKGRDVGHGCQRSPQAGQSALSRPCAGHAQGKQRRTAVVDIAAWETGLRADDGEHFGSFVQQAAHRGVVGVESHLTATVNTYRRRAKARDMLAHAVESNFMF